MNGHIADTFVIFFSAILTVTQKNETFRTISLILTIIATAVVLARNIYDWYIKAKRDGKIDKDEVKDLIDSVDEVVNDIKDEVDKNKKD